jgi:hypothetical protein
LVSHYAGMMIDRTRAERAASAKKKNSPRHSSSPKKRKSPG